MSLTVAHLIGAFPNLYEHAVLTEVAATAGPDVAPHVVALHPSGRPLPENLADLGRHVTWLDAAASCGRIVRAAASMMAALGGLAASPGLVSAALAPGLSHASDFHRRVRLGRVLRRLSPALVHAQFGHLGLWAAPVVRHVGCRLVVSFRGQDVRLVGRAQAPARESLFRSAERVFVRSEEMMRDLVAMGCPAEKTIVLPSGIEMDAVPFSERTHPGREEDVRVLMAGRAVPKKGMEDALRAVAESGLRVQVRIAGDGPLLPALRSLASELGLADSVTFLGALPRADVIGEMRAAHVFMLTPRTTPDGEKEGIPNVLKEAQAAGLPVVATRHSGIAECVLHEETGLLADEGDVAAIAQNLRALVSQPECWGAMGRSGREHTAARYDVIRTAAQLVEHYHAIS